MSKEKADKKRDKEFQFLADLWYSNELPPIPFEPKFLKVPQNKGRFFKYKTTSLEKNYKHEIYMEPKICPPIALINPDLLIQNAPETVDERDLALVAPDEMGIILPNRQNVSMYSTAAYVEKAEKIKKGKAKAWLKKTIYLENDLGDSVHKYKSEFDHAEERKRKLELEEEELKRKKQALSKQERIEKTFTDVSDLKQRLESEEKEVEAIYEILPSTELAEELFHIRLADFVVNNQQTSKTLTSTQVLDSCLISSSEGEIQFLTKDSPPEHRFKLKKSYKYSITESTDKFGLFFVNEDDIEDTSHERHCFFRKIEPGMINLTKQRLERSKGAVSFNLIERQENQENDDEDLAVESD